MKKACNEMLVKLTPPLVVVPKTFGKVCPLHPVVSVQVEPELKKTLSF
jgi:hypothetical protein